MEPNDRRREGCERLAFAMAGMSGFAARPTKALEWAGTTLDEQRPGIANHAAARIPECQWDDND
jgi:hypothetical protein